MPTAQKIISGPAKKAETKGSGIYKIQIKTEQTYNVLNKKDYKEKLSKKFRKMNRAYPEICWKDWTIKVSFCKSSERATDYQPEKLVAGVRFNLHEDYELPDGITVKERPYEINNRGFGSFNVDIEIFPRKKHFPEFSEFRENVERRSRTVRHYLNLDAGREWETSRHEIEYVNPGVEFHEALEESGIDFLVKNIEKSHDEASVNQSSQIDAPRKSKKSKKDKKERSSIGTTFLVTETESRDSTNFTDSHAPKKEKKSKKNKKDRQSVPTPTSIEQNSSINSISNNSKKRKSEILPNNKYDNCAPDVKKMKKVKPSKSLPQDITQVRNLTPREAVNSPASLSSVVSNVSTNDTCSVSTTTNSAPIKLKFKLNNGIFKDSWTSNPASPNINMMEGRPKVPGAGHMSAFQRVESKQRILDTPTPSGPLVEEPDNILNDGLSDEEITNLYDNNETDNNSNTDIITPSSTEGRIHSIDLPNFESPNIDYGNLQQTNINSQLSRNTMNSFINNVHELTGNDGHNNVRNNSTRTSSTSSYGNNNNSTSTFQQGGNNYSAFHPIQNQNTNTKRSNFDSPADKRLRKKQRDKEKRLLCNTQWNNFDIRYKELMVEKISTNFANIIDNNPEDAIILKVSSILYPIDYAVDVAYRNNYNSSSDGCSKNSSGLGDSSQNQNNEIIARSSSQIPDENCANITNNDEIQNNNRRISETNSEITNLSSVDGIWDENARNQEMRAFDELENMVDSDNGNNEIEMGFNLSDLKGFEIYKLCKVLGIEFGIV